MTSPFIDIGSEYKWVPLDIVSLVEHDNHSWVALTSDHDAVVFCGHGNPKGMLSYDKFSGLSIQNVEDAVDEFIGMKTDIPIYIIACYPKRVKEAIGETERTKVVGDWDREVYAPLNTCLNMVGVYPESNLPM